MVFPAEKEAKRNRSEAPNFLRATSLFQPDTVMPFQYFEMLRRKTHLEGEKDLMLATLEDAIACFRKYHLARDKKGKELFHEVEAWIMKEKNDRLFSFASICESLEINPDYLRRGLRKWREKDLSARKREKGGENS